MLMKIPETTLLTLPSFLKYVLSLPLLLFILSICFEHGDAVYWINRNHNPGQDFIFPIITNLGDGLVFIPLMLITLFVKFEYTIMTIALSIGHGILVSLCKRVIFPGAPRPSALLDQNLLHFIPGVEVHSSFSFPSGHTTTAFCAALFICLITRSPWVRLMVLVLALLVAYSRIYLLQHFLIDVAAGAVVGCFTTLAIWKVFESHKKPKWMNKKLRFQIIPSSPESMQEGRMA